MARDYGVLSNADSWSLSRVPVCSSFNCKKSRNNLACKISPLQPVFGRSDNDMKTPKLVNAANCQKLRW